MTNRAIDSIMVASLAPMQEEAIRRAPRSTLKRGIVTRKVKNLSRFTKEFWVSFKRGNAMRIAHLIEFGTAPHSLAKGASRRKNYLQDRPPFHPGTRPHPFFRPAYEATKDEVFLKAGEGLWDFLIGQIGH